MVEGSAAEDTVEELSPGAHTTSAATTDSSVVTGLQPGRAASVPRTGSLTASGACKQSLEKLSSLLGAKKGQAVTTPPLSVYKQLCTASVKTLWSQPFKKSP